MADLGFRQTLLQKETLEKRLEELEIISLIDGTVLSVQEQSVPNATTTVKSHHTDCNLTGIIATGHLSRIYHTLKVAVGHKVTPIIRCCAR